MIKATHLLLVHHLGQNDAAHVFASRFAERVRLQSKGSIDIRIVSDATLGNVHTLIDMVAEGAADLGIPPYDRLVRRLPKFGCVAQPFFFDDLDHVGRVLDGEFEAWVRPDLEKLGLVLLSRWEWGFRQISNARRRVLLPEDMSGLRIRVPPVFPYREIVRALGGIPVMVEYHKTLEVIRQGLIDGQENPVHVIESLGMLEGQSYLSMLNSSYGTLGLMINRKSLQGLPDTQQAVLREAAMWTGRLMRRFGRRQESDLLGEFSRRGLCIDWPDQAPFRNLMEPVYREFPARCGEDNVRVFVGMVERQRRNCSSKTGGGK